MMSLLFLSALLHDFDPLKESEKPHNDNVESFIRNDKELAKLIVPFETDLNIVLALIRRTMYPFNGKQKEHALERMEELFSLARIHKDDTVTRNHYEQLGWFLSICDRIAGYSLGDFKYARELARRNAISMAWPPSVINEQVVKYFKSLKVEKKMLDYVLMGFLMITGKIYLITLQALGVQGKTRLGQKQFKTLLIREFSKQLSTGILRKQRF